MKKLISLIILTLVFTLIGCSKESSQTSNEKDKEEGKPTLKVLGFNAPFDPNKSIMAKDIAETTGYDTEYFMLPSENPDQKLNIEIAAGADYDILALSPGQFYTLASQGALLPLNDLLDKHGKNIEKANNQDSWDLTTIDGDIFGIPQKNERANIEAGLYVREDILKELNIETPKTLDEFHTALKKIKESKTDIVPLTGGPSIWIPSIFSAFGLATDWTEVDGELLPRILMPQTKEYVSFFQDLYKEDLLDKDWAINQPNTVKEKFASGKAAFMFASWNDAPQIIPTLKETVPNSEVAIVQPLEGEDGQVGIQASQRLMWVHAIPKSAKHAEDAVKFMDSKLDFDNFQFLTLGKEGDTFKVENGAYTPIMPKFTETRQDAWWYLNGMDENKYPDMWLARLRKNPDLFKYFEIINKSYDQYAKSNPKAWAPPMESESQNGQSLSKMEEDYFIRLLLGNEKLSSFDTFIEKQWKPSGGEEIVKDVNEWYSKQK